MCLQNDMQCSPYPKLLWDFRVSRHCFVAKELSFWLFQQPFGLLHQCISGTSEVSIGKHSAKEDTDDKRSLWNYDDCADFCEVICQGFRKFLCSETSQDVCYICLFFRLEDYWKYLVD